jgi:hypothetical protein
VIPVRAPAPPMEKLAARSHIAPGTPVLPRVGMNRRSPDPISRAATASADVGQGHPPRTRDRHRTQPARASPLTRRPHPCRALFEAAQQACRPASPDYQYYRQVARRIDHNRACLSVARKLCRRAYHILRELGDEALAPIEPAPLDEEVITAAA